MTTLELQRKLLAAGEGFDGGVIIASPRRLLSYLNEGHSLIDLSGVRQLVLDECDRLLSLGFLPDRQLSLSLSLFFDLPCQGLTCFA